MHAIGFTKSGQLALWPQKLNPTEKSSSQLYWMLILINIVVTMVVINITTMVIGMSTMVVVKQGGHHHEQDGRKMSLVTGPLHRPMASGGHSPHCILLHTLLKVKFHLQYTTAALLVYTGVATLRLASSSSSV